MSNIRINWRNALIGLAMFLLALAGWFLPTQDLQPLPEYPEGAVGSRALAGGDVSNFTGLVVAAPTTMPTATPAAVIDNKGVSVILEVRDSATPVARFPNGGGFDVLSGQVDIGDWINLSAQSTVAVSNGGTITAAGTYQTITSTAWVTTSTTTAVADGSEAGDLLILRNGNASDNITVDGAGANVECGGDVVLGPNDTLLLIWNGSDWVCLANHNN